MQITSKFSIFQFSFTIWLLVFSISPYTTSATDDVTEKVEDSTESPIAAMEEMESEMKTSTEKPPLMETPRQDEKPNSQRHTVADFIIHPLIAFKPRNPEQEEEVAAAGDPKQASQTSTSSTTPSPWQLFGFNAGQGLGSSVSSLAGSVTGWINDRIQLPGLVETPVRESTTSSSTSTTTTPRPDVVVRVQHKPTTRRPLISINRNRPNFPNFDSNEIDDDEDIEDEEDDDFDDNEPINEFEENELSNEQLDGEDEGESYGDGEGEGESSNEKEDGYVSNSEEEENEVVDRDGGEEDNEEINEDDEEENYPQRPNNRRRPVKNKNTVRRGNGSQNSRRGAPNRRQQPSRYRPTNFDDESEEDAANDFDDNDNNSFYYGERPSTKRSQSNPNFIQRSQQQLINQIRQLTRVQTPAEIGAAMRKTEKKNGANRRRQQATIFMNRNGQTVYLAPELGGLGQPQYHAVIKQHIVQSPSAFPQPPLTTPHRQKGQPVQYITIPWSQLGISPPNNLVSITEGIQSQPYILNIPQSAIHTMQSQARPVVTPNRRKKRPQAITPQSVPLLAEASLMDIFKPPQIPPDRTSSNGRPVSGVSPVLVSAKPHSSKATPLVQKRIRPGTIVEKAPSMPGEKIPEESEISASDESKVDVHRAQGDNEYILVGKDDEPGIMRQVDPVYGDARYVRLNGNSQLYDISPRRRLTIHRGGRELLAAKDETEQKIPVHVVSIPEAVPSSNVQQLDTKSSEHQTTEPMKKAEQNSKDSLVQPESLPQVLTHNIQSPHETKST